MEAEALCQVPFTLGSVQGTRLHFGHTVELHRHEGYFWAVFPDCYESTVGRPAGGSPKG